MGRHNVRWRKRARLGQVNVPEFQDYSLFPERGRGGGDAVPYTNRRPAPANFLQGGRCGVGLRPCTALLRAASDEAGGGPPSSQPLLLAAPGSRTG